MKNWSAYDPSYPAAGELGTQLLTWQDDYPGVAIARHPNLEAANKFLNERYIDEFNRRFMVPAAQRGRHHILPEQEP